MATEVSFSVPPGSLQAWKERLHGYNARYGGEEDGFGEEVLHCCDPDGLNFNMVVADEKDTRQGWSNGDIPDAMAVKGLHSVSLMVKNMERTAQVLTDIFGYTLVDRKANKSRFATGAAASANIIDLVEEPDGPDGYVAGGTIHHVALRVKSNETLNYFRERILSRGFNITPKTDMAYFSSFYFREPGGVLFELASDDPGFTADETVEELGTQLKLPARLEYMRDKLEHNLPPLSR